MHRKRSSGNTFTEARRLPVGTMSFTGGRLPSAMTKSIDPSQSWHFVTSSTWLDMLIFVELTVSVLSCILEIPINKRRNAVFERNRRRVTRTAWLNPDTAAIHFPAASAPSPPCNHVPDRKKGFPDRGNRTFFFVTNIVDFQV